ncbi:MAG: DUF973 family protein [Desulfurococcales archaeon]|nr:DUF973 family protein [Desulfurococcales archaeon]
MAVVASSYRRWELLYRGADGVFKSYLLSFIAFILAFAAVLAAGVAGMGAIMHGGNVGAALRSSVGSFATLALIALVLILASLYYLWDGFRSLKEYDASRFGVGVTGLKVYLAAVIVVLLAVLALIPGAMTASPVSMGLAVGLFILGGILAIVGAIMIAIALWRLGDEPGGSLVKLGVILWFLGILLGVTRAGSVLAFIGSILIMLGARDVRDKASQAMRAPPPQEPSPGASGSI